MNLISIQSSLIFRLSIVVATWLTCSTTTISAQELNWQTDLQQAIQQAEKEQKLVLLHFTAAWSKSCQDIQTFVFSSPQVQRAIHANVIPVRIDVDEQVELTSQYGIGKVPYDIVITPSKRIIARRESPKEAVGYNSMIVRLEKTIQQMAQQGSSTLDQNLDDFQALMKKADPIRQQESLTPKPPSHQAAQIAQDSQELNRKFVTNPAFAAKQAAAAAKTSDNVAATVASAEKEIPTDKKVPQAAGPLKIINPNFFVPSGPNSQRPLTNATMQPNLQRPPAFIDPSVNDARPQSIEKAKFVGNPTAAATEFKAVILADKNTPKLSPPKPTKSIESTPATQFNPTPAEVSTPDKPVEKLLDQISTPTSKPGLHGKCPVTLLREGRWVEGSKQWGCIHRNQTYLFASQEKLSTFLADPDAYSPLLAGFDPVVFNRTGKLVAGLEEHGVFMGKAPNQRVILFSDMNTRREFEANPKKYLLTIREAMENSGGGSSPVEH